MKKRRPSFQNPFYLEGNKYNSDSKGYGDHTPPESKKRFCNFIKKGKQCKNVLTSDRYFNCKKCQPELPLENGFDSCGLK